MEAEQNSRGGPSSFLQSDAWEEFQRAVGRETFRIRGALIVRHSLPLGYRYLYSPRPAVAGSEFFSELEALSRDRGAVFAKIDPAISWDVDSRRMVPSRSIQPRETRVLDIGRPEVEILSRMHEKTRYNIRLAAKKGVSVSGLMGGFETFFSLLGETARREKFRLHDRRYYETLISMSSRDFANRVFVAHFKGEPLAAALVNFYRPSGVATYLHGGSRDAGRGLMAPHLLHWEIMREARRLGFLQYDFWGVDHSRWPGITRFKEGFRGAAVSYPASADIVYRPIHYSLYQTLRRLAGRT